MDKSWAVAPPDIALALSALSGPSGVGNIKWCSCTEFRRNRRPQSITCFMKPNCGIVRVLSVVLAPEPTQYDLCMMRLPPVTLSKQMSAGGVRVNKGLPRGKVCDDHEFTSIPPVPKKCRKQICGPPCGMVVNGIDLPLAV